MRCKNCGEKLGGGTQTCPKCGGTVSVKPVLSWGRAKNTVMDQWPLDTQGDPEEAVFLTHCSNTDLEDDMLTQMLTAYGIPSVRRYPNDGDLGRIYLGVSASGVDIYVPESMLDEAQALITSGESTSEDAQELIEDEE